MRPARITLSSGGHLSCRALEAGCASLEVGPHGAPASTVEFAEGELLRAIEEFAAVYAEICGADPYRLARAVTRTVANRTRAARERRSAASNAGQP